MEYIDLNWVFIDFRKWYQYREDGKWSDIWLSQYEIEVEEVLKLEEYRKVPWYKHMFSFRIPTPIKYLFFFILGIIVREVFG